MCVSNKVFGGGLLSFLIAWGERVLLTGSPALHASIPSSRQQVCKDLMLQMSIAFNDPAGPFMDSADTCPVEKRGLSQRYVRLF